MKDVKVEIHEIVMSHYNNVKLRSTLFFESWENSINGGLLNRIRKIFHIDPPLCRVIVQFSKEALVREKNKSANIVNLDHCKQGDIGVYLAQMLSYDSERNNAKMRLLSKDGDLAGTIIQGSPLCSEKYFAGFWRKYLRKYGDMEEVLTK